MKAGFFLCFKFPLSSLDSFYRFLGMKAKYRKVGMINTGSIVDHVGGRVLFLSV